MQVRVTGLRVAPGELEELTNTYQTSILPELRHQQGFSSLLLLSDAETGRVLELTLFEDEDARRESEEQGGTLDWKLDTLTRGFNVVPDIENYDLKILSSASPRLFAFQATAHNLGAKFVILSQTRILERRPQDLTSVAPHTACA